MGNFIEVISIYFHTFNSLWSWHKKEKGKWNVALNFFALPFTSGCCELLTETYDVTLVFRLRKEYLYAVAIFLSCFIERKDRFCCLEHVAWAFNDVQLLPKWKKWNKITRSQTFGMSIHLKRCPSLESMCSGSFAQSRMPWFHLIYRRRPLLIFVYPLFPPQNPVSYRVFRWSLKSKCGNNESINNKCMWIIVLLITNYFLVFITNLTCSHGIWWSKFGKLFSVDIWRKKGNVFPKTHTHIHIHWTKWHIYI